MFYSFLEFFELLDVLFFCFRAAIFLMFISFRSISSHFHQIIVSPTFLDLFFSTLFSLPFFLSLKGIVFFFEYLSFADSTVWSKRNHSTIL
jgi:hypothetical protein